MTATVPVVRGQRVVVPNIGGGHRFGVVIEAMRDEPHVIVRHDDAQDTKSYHRLQVDSLEIAVGRQLTALWETLAHVTDGERATVEDRLAAYRVDVYAIDLARATAVAS